MDKADNNPERTSGFTIFHHDLLDSPAALLLNGNALALLIEFYRRWSKATRNGRKPRNSIFFAWSTYPRVITRGAFNRARSELVKRGFLRATNVAIGAYALSQAWRDYEPTPEEQARTEKHTRARAVRVSERARVCRDQKSTPACLPSRGQKLTPTTHPAAGSRGQKPTPTPGEEPRGGVGVKNRAPGRGLKWTPSHYPNTKEPTTNQDPEGTQGEARSAAELSPDDGNGGGGSAAHLVDPEVRTRFPEFKTSAELLRYGTTEFEAGRLTEEEHDTLLAIFDEMEAAERATAAKRQAESDPDTKFKREWADTERRCEAEHVANGEQLRWFSGPVCRALGDDSTNARKNIADAMRGKMPSHVAEVVGGILRDLAKPGHNIGNPIGLAIHRLGGAS
jgi:hypothetical protein